MREIIGNTTATPNPRPDWNQTDATKADFIKNKPDLNVFANSLKGTTSGEAISITDISPVEHNMAVSVRGKNLIKFPSVDLNYRSGYEKTTNGVTFTVNDDGSVYARGSATNEAYFNLCKLNLKTNRTYVMSGGENGTSYASVNLSISKRVTYQEDNSLVYIHIPKGTVIDEVLYPQIEYGTTLTPFAPYIEDLSTVKLYKQGKNLLSPYVLYEGLKDYQEGIDETTGRKYIRFVDNKTKRFNWKFKKNTQYTVSAWVKTTIRNNDNTTNSHFLYFWYTDGTTSTVVIGRNKDWTFVSKTSSPGKTIQSIGMYTHNYANYVYVDVDTFMLEEGTTPTEYEPYIEPTLYDVAADGNVEGVISLYPNTTLYIDTSGAVIDCTYNRDINKISYENAIDTEARTDIAQLRTELGKKADKEDIVNVYEYHGSVNTFNDLPTEYDSIEKGAVYNVLDTEMNYAWNGTEWDPLGGKHKDLEARAEIEKLEKYGTTDVYVLKEGVDYITDETGTQIIAPVDGKELNYIGQTVTVPEGITSMTLDEPPYFAYLINCDTFICPSSLIFIDIACVNAKKFILNDNIERICLDSATDAYPQTVEIKLTNSSTTIEGYELNGNIIAPANIDKISTGFEYFQGSIYVYNPKATIYCNIEFDEEIDKKQIKIHGYAGSTAEKYAKENGYTFVNMGSDYTDEINFKLYGTTDVYTLTEDDINIDSNGCFCSQKYEEIAHDVIIIPEGITEIKPYPLEFDPDTTDGWPEEEYAINLRSEKTICPSTLISLITVHAPNVDPFFIEHLGDNVILNEGLQTLDFGADIAAYNGIGDINLPTTLETRLITYGLEDTLVLPKDMEKIKLDIIFPYSGKLYVYNPEMDFSEVYYESSYGETVTIYGYLGSTAYNYAKEHDIKFMDIENDSSIMLNGLNFDNTVIRPNEYYTFTNTSSLTIELDWYSSDYKLNEYMFSFETPETVDNSFLQIISYKEIKWVKEPNLKPNYIYEVSIVNNVGVIAGIPKEVS